MLNKTLQLVVNDSVVELGSVTAIAKAIETALNDDHDLTESDFEIYRVEPVTYNLDVTKTPEVSVTDPEGYEKHYTIEIKGKEMDSEWYSLSEVEDVIKEAYENDPDLEADEIEVTLKQLASVDFVNFTHQVDLYIPGEEIETVEEVEKALEDMTEAELKAKQQELLEQISEVAKLLATKF
jgi:hypothetical protein